MTEVAVNIRSDMDTVRLRIGNASAFMQVYRMFLRCFVRREVSMRLDPKLRTGCASEGVGSPKSGVGGGAETPIHIPAHFQ